MSGGLTFHEKMTGPVALGATDPAVGASAPQAAPLSINCRIAIDDIDRFVADVNHTGVIEGSLEYAAFGGELPVMNGVFNLFKKEDGQRVMEYRLPFDYDGRAHLLAGRKHVRDEPGFDVWKDTTTLYTLVHESAEESGAIVAAGILTIGVEALARMTASMRPSEGGGIDSLVKFGRLFMGELWETYGKTKL